MKTNFTRGIFYACLAAIWWGMPQPLFFDEIKYIPSFEVAMHRGAWSFFVLSLSLIFFSEINEFFSIFKSSKKIIILTITSLLIATNWLGFIYSVSINKVQDASLGYFLTPMISISLGYFILNENLNTRKVISVSLMLFACFVLFTSLDSFPYLALLIGTTWGIYGLLRKQIKVSPATGLLYESGLITIFALPYLIYLNHIDVDMYNFMSSGNQSQPGIDPRGISSIWMAVGSFDLNPGDTLKFRMITLQGTSEDDVRESIQRFDENNFISSLIFHGNPFNLPIPFSLSIAHIILNFICI